MKFSSAIILSQDLEIIRLCDEVGDEIGTAGQSTD